MISPELCIWLILDLCIVDHNGFFHVSSHESFDDDVNKRKEQLYAETIDDAGLSTLYRVDDEQKGQEEEDNKKRALDNFGTSRKGYQGR